MGRLNELWPIPHLRFPPFFDGIRLFVFFFFPFEIHIVSFSALVWLKRGKGVSRNSCLFFVVLQLCVVLGLCVEGVGGEGRGTALQ